jgi:hypothetical protein
MLLECEGETQVDFARLLRHELGHAFDHAYRVSQRRSWELVFGSKKKEYNPDTYHPRPYSRSFVQNLRNWYSQSHPDEDFAETFAVWLNPQSQWEQAYKGWGALRKLEYVDRIASQFGPKEMKTPIGRQISETRFLTSTLSKYYQRKLKYYEEDLPSFFDRDLLRLFAHRDNAAPQSQRASRFMQQNRKVILNSTARWTGEKKVTINQLISRLIKRCQELELVVSKPEAEVCVEVSAYISTLISHYLFTGHFRRTV